MEVLRDCEYRGKESGLLKAFMLLCPGNIDDHVERVMVQMFRADSKASDRSTPKEVHRGNKYLCSHKDWYYFGTVFVVL